MGYREAFPDYDAATMPDVPKTWTDISWRNDACPSFKTWNGAIVFVDYEDPNDREFPDCKRFSVHVDPDLDESRDMAVIVETNDWLEVVRAVASRPPLYVLRDVETQGSDFMLWGRDLRAALASYERATFEDGIRVEIVSGGLPRRDRRLDRCNNSEPGRFNHECGRPATWIKTALGGDVPGLSKTGAYLYRVGFCDRCKDGGAERHGAVAWERA